MYAAEEGHAGCVQALVEEEGLDINVQDIVRIYFLFSHSMDGSKLSGNFL